MLLLYSLIIPVITIPVKQGLAGKVYLKHGNHMPSPGRAIDKGKPVSSSIWIYKLTTRDDATADNGGHYTNIKTQLVSKGQSNADGSYAIELLPGQYSVFVEDNNMPYANTFDGKGHINPIEVKKDSLTTLDLTISSNAVY